MVIKLKEFAKNVKISESDLITRPVGKLIYNKFIENVKNISEGETVIIDFTNIKVIDFSFVDEFIINLIDYAKKGKKFYIKLKNVSKIAQKNIEAVIKSYAEYNKKVLVITESLSIKNTFYLGDMSENENKVFNSIRINNYSTQEDLKLITQMDIKDLSESLSNLLDFNCIKLDSDGKYAII
jgi:ribosomal protein S13